MSEPIRSRQARDLAETALVRLVRAYGAVPEFVLLGGLVPDLLCSQAPRAHVGTTDVDVQVNLEIQGGSANAARLEHALKDAGFRPDSTRIWRWKDETAPGLVVKVEFLADLDDAPAQSTVRFEDCEDLGAVNLRGTGFASQAWELRPMTAIIDDHPETVEVRVATLPGYLLAKIHAAYGRRLEKDWYDIAYVLIHNDAGGPTAASAQIRERFGGDLVGQTATALTELSANFADATAQGSVAYAETMFGLYPELDADILANDAVAAVAAFIGELRISR